MKSILTAIIIVSIITAMGLGWACTHKTKHKRYVVFKCSKKIIPQSQWAICAMNDDSIFLCPITPCVTIHDTVKINKRKVKNDNPNITTVSSYGQTGGVTANTIINK